MSTKAESDEEGDIDTQHVLAIKAARGCSKGFSDWLTGLTLPCSLLLRGELLVAFPLEAQTVTFISKAIRLRAGPQLLPSALYIMQDMRPLSWFRPYPVLAFLVSGSSMLLLRRLRCILFTLQLCTNYWRVLHI